MTEAAPASLFTQMMRGERPARFLWSDERAVAVLSPTPLSPGHSIVVPRDVVDYWIDLDPALLHHVMDVAREVSRAIQVAFNPPKVGMLVAGIEVRHVHLHLVPIRSARDFDFQQQDNNPDPAALDAAAALIRATLRDLGHSDTVPAA